MARRSQKGAQCEVTRAEGCKEEMHGSRTARNSKNSVNGGLKVQRTTEHASNATIDQMECVSICLGTHYPCFLTNDCWMQRSCFQNHDGSMPIRLKQF